VEDEETPIAPSQAVGFVFSGAMRRYVVRVLRASRRHDMIEPAWR
jgi:hypothetical protein